MKRRLFNLLTVLSLLMGGTTAVYWIRSCHVAEQWEFHRFNYTVPAGFPNGNTISFVSKPLSKLSLRLLFANAIPNRIKSVK